MMFVLKECDSASNKIDSRLTTNGLAFARKALSKTSITINTIDKIDQFNLKQFETCSYIKYKIYKTNKIFWRCNDNLI